MPSSPTAILPRDDVHFDLNLLRVVLALEKTRHVGRAAELLQMSQSGFSSALSRLRRHANDQVFVRTGDGMSPTPYGTRLAVAAAEAFERFETRVLAGAEFDPTSATTVFRLAMTDLAETVFLPPLLEHLQEKAPGVSVVSEPLVDDALRQALANGSMDLALGIFPGISGAPFLHQRLYRHTFACILRNQHPAVSGPMTRSLYGSLGHAVVSAPSNSGKLLENWLARHRIERRIVLRTPHHLSLPAIIEKTDLVATVPLAVAQWFARHGAVRIAPLPLRPELFDVQQYWHRRYQDEPRIRWLRQTIAELFNDRSDGWLEIEESLYGKRTQRLVRTRIRRHRSQRSP